MCEQCLTLQVEIDRLKKTLVAEREKLERVCYQIGGMTADLCRARAIARQYGFTATEDDTCEGLVRNLLTVLEDER